MQLIQESTDTLTLDLIKNHLVISHNLDDALLEHYKQASLEVVEEYLNRSLLERIYETTANEVGGDNKLSVLVAECPYYPKGIIVYYDDGSQEDNITFYYDEGSHIITFYNETEKNVTKFEAFAVPQKVFATQQARLLIIGNWYEFRNADTPANIKQVPTGLMFIVDKLKGAEL